MKLIKQIISCILLILILSIGFTSCKNDETKVIDSYNKRNITFDGDVRNCIVIPLGGCGGCIADGISYVRHHRKDFQHDQNRNMIVLTGISSKKMLRRTLSSLGPDSLNIIYDYEDKYKAPGALRIYPLAINVDNGIITEVHVKSPRDPHALDYLEL